MTEEWMKMFMKHQKIEELPKYEKRMVDIWQCSSCIGWMQKEFTISSNPTCPLCSGSMVEDTREINMRME
jgi:hypothetical protein